MKNTIVRFTLLAVALGAAGALALAAAQPAQGSRALIKGIFDEAETIGRPKQTFPLLRTLRTEAVRINLYWSDVAVPQAAARHRPGRQGLPVGRVRPRG